jgi:hypothetical protein
MQRYYDTIAEFSREGFDIIVDKTYEDMHPRDSFDDSVIDLEEIIKDIDRGHLDWFILRVRAMFDGHELAAEYLGGCLYEDPNEVLTDGTAEDLIGQALEQARKEAALLRARLIALDLEGLTGV